MCVRKPWNCNKAALCDHNRNIVTEAHSLTFVACGVAIILRVCELFHASRISAKAFNVRFIYDNENVKLMSL